MRFFPNRRTVRLQLYDYGSANAYFITICTYRRHHLFGEIRNDIICLNELGAAVWAEWQKTLELRPHYTSHAFQIMPNHLHGLLRITRPPEDIWNDSRIAAFGGSPKDTLGTMLGGFKSAVTSIAHNMLGMEGRIWQGGFYEHVVRNKEDFDRIALYICSNTRNWKEDRFYDE